MANESKPAPATIIHEEQPLKFESAIAELNSLWLETNELKRLTKWELKPEGICRGDLTERPKETERRRARNKDLAGNHESWVRGDSHTRAVPRFMLFFA